MHHNRGVTIIIFNITKLFKIEPISFNDGGGVDGVNHTP